jgi:Holliday junction resolvasome RuvABC endonuclease subunit
MIKFNKNDQIAEGNVKIEKISRGKNKGKPKKIDIKLLVQDYLKMAFGIVEKDSDRADAIVLALAGLAK